MSNLTVWSRRDPFVRFDRQFDRQFDALVRGAFVDVATRPAAFAPAAEVSREGIDVARDVTVEIERGRLVVCGERRDERAEQRDGRSLREVRYGAFRRSFGLPAHVIAEQLQAGYDAGVLTVRVAGAYAGAAPTKIAVSAGPSAPTVASGADEQPGTEQQPRTGEQPADGAAQA